MVVLADPLATREVGNAFAMLGHHRIRTSAHCALDDPPGRQQRISQQDIAGIEMVWRGSKFGLVLDSARGGVLTARVQSL